MTHKANSPYSTFMVTLCHGNAFCVTGPLWWESIGHNHCGFPTQRTSCTGIGVFYDVNLNTLSNKQQSVLWDVMTLISLEWRHNERHGFSNHRRLHCLLSCWFRRRSKKAPKLRVTGLCAGNSPVTGEFPAQKASNAENVSIWWRLHVTSLLCTRSIFALFELTTGKLYQDRFIDAQQQYLQFQQTLFWMGNTDLCTMRFYNFITFKDNKK